MKISERIEKIETETEELTEILDRIIDKLKVEVYPHFRGYEISEFGVRRVDTGDVVSINLRDYRDQDTGLLYIPVDVVDGGDERVDAWVEEKAEEKRAQRAFTEKANREYEIRRLEDRLAKLKEQDA